MLSIFTNKGEFMKFIVSLSVIAIGLSASVAFAGDSSGSFKRIEKIPDGKAIIYFFRGECGNLLDRNSSTKDLEEPIVIEQENSDTKLSLKAFNYKTLEVLPGTYRFKSSDATVKVVAEAGKEYCVKGIYDNELLAAANTEGLEPVPLDYCMYHIKNTTEVK